VDEWAYFEDVRVHGNAQAGCDAEVSRERIGKKVDVEVALGTGVADVRTAPAQGEVVDLTLSDDEMDVVSHASAGDAGRRLGLATPPPTPDSKRPLSRH
jgi:hypothetical protein